MRYFIELSYKGGAYHGWQRQNNASSVQQILEKALSTILQAETPIIGAGRTDAGVHARYFVAHFDTTQIEKISNIEHRLNLMLPVDIAIHSITPVVEDAHARFDALLREYKYRVIYSKDPFLNDTAWRFHTTLDIEAMNLAAEELLRAEDFTTFSKLHSNNNTHICEVTYAQWVECGDGVLFTIRANRFLRNMVRAIVGTLVDVGRKKITPERFREILHSKDRTLASSSAPAEGLFLNDIKYPEHIQSLLPKEK